MIIPLWQKLIGVLIYLIPLSDAIPFGRYLFMDFPFLQWIQLPALPIIIIKQSLPFGGFLLFFLLFLIIVRNPKMPYFLRFNTLQALLIDIGIILINYTFQIILQPLGTKLIISTLSSTFLMTILAIVIFAVGECLQGKEPDLPLISEAVRMQL